MGCLAVIGGDDYYHRLLRERVIRSVADRVGDGGEEEGTGCGRALW